MSVIYKYVIIFYLEFIALIISILSIINIWLLKFWYIYLDKGEINNNIIYFNNICTKYIGFSIAKSISRYHKRIIFWFYKINKIPTWEDWNKLIKEFHLNRVPYHKLRLYDMNKNKTKDYITIYKITSKYITYRYNNLTAKFPITMGSLIPEFYIKNMEKLTK